MLVPSLPSSLLFYHLRCVVCFFLSFPLLSTMVRGGLILNYALVEGLSSLFPDTVGFTDASILRDLSLMVRLDLTGSPLSLGSAPRVFSSAGNLAVETSSDDVQMNQSLIVEGDLSRIGLGMSSIQWLICSVPRTHLLWRSNGVLLTPLVVTPG